jgi:hypothetical protein
MSMFRAAMSSIGERNRPHRRALRTAAAAGAWALALVPGLAAQDDTPPVTGLRLAAEVGLGVVGTPIGFVSGGLLTRWAARRLGASDQRASDAAYAGAWVGAALVTAVGPTLVGSQGRATGSYGAALAGTVAGGLGSYLLVRLFNRDEGDDRPCTLLCSAAAVGVFILPGVGATVGFNLSRRYER